MHNLNRKKWTIVLISALSALSCFTVGFASWVIPVSGDTTYLQGFIDRDQYEDSYKYIACISNVHINNLDYVTGYGFIDPDTSALVKNSALTGTFDLDVEKLKTCVDSFTESNRYFSLKIEFITSLTTNFTFGTPSIGGFSNNPVSKSVSSTATKAAAYNVTLNAAEFSSTKLEGLSFSISISYSGSSFPDLSNVSYTMSFTPGEYIAS